MALNDGSFGDNMSSFLGDLTGEVYKRKQEERAMQLQDEDKKLQLGLNLFSQMMADPDRYNEDQIRTFAGMLGKDHRLEKIIGTDVQSAITPLLQKRTQMHQEYQSNQQIQALLGRIAPGINPTDLSPYQYRQLLMSAAQYQNAQDQEERQIARENLRLLYQEATKRRDMAFAAQKRQEEQKQEQEWRTRESRRSESEATARSEAEMAQARDLAEMQKRYQLGIASGQNALHLKLAELQYRPEVMNAKNEVGLTRELFRLGNTSGLTGNDLDTYVQSGIQTWRNRDKLPPLTGVPPSPIKGDTLGVKPTAPPLNSPNRPISQNGAPNETIFDTLLGVGKMAGTYSKGLNRYLGLLP